MGLSAACPGAVIMRQSELNFMKGNDVMTKSVLHLSSSNASHDQGSTCSLRAINSKSAKHRNWTVGKALQYVYKLHAIQLMYNVFEVSKLVALPDRRQPSIYCHEWMVQYILTAMPVRGGGRLVVGEC